MTVHTQKKSHQINNAHRFHFECCMRFYTLFLLHERQEKKQFLEARKTENFDVV